MVGAELHLEPLLGAHQRAGHHPCRSIHRGMDVSARTPGAAGRDGRDSPALSTSRWGPCSVRVNSVANASMDLWGQEGSCWGREKSCLDPDSREIGKVELHHPDVRLVAPGADLAGGLQQPRRHGVMIPRTPSPSLASYRTFSPASSEREQRITLAPPLASAATVSTPMPELPPGGKEWDKLVSLGTRGMSMGVPSRVQGGRTSASCIDSPVTTAVLPLRSTPEAAKASSAVLR